MSPTSHNRISADCLVRNLLANIDCRALSDAEFREFVRIGLRQVHGGLPSVPTALEEACRQVTQVTQATLAPDHKETA